MQNAECKIEMQFLCCHCEGRQARGNLREVPTWNQLPLDFRVGAKVLPCALLVQNQVPAQPLRSLDSSGMALSLPAALRLRQGKRLPNFFAPFLRRWRRSLEVHRRRSLVAHVVGLAACSSQ